MKTTAAATTDITCTCEIHKGAVTIRVPSAMLVNPNGKRTTPRYIATVTHNLIDMNRLVRKYPVV